VLLKIPFIPGNQNLPPFLYLRIYFPVGDVSSVHPIIINEKVIYGKKVQFALLHTANSFACTTAFIFFLFRFFTTKSDHSALSFRLSAALCICLQLAAYSL
jgi:hypothetical protein